MPVIRLDNPKLLEEMVRKGRERVVKNRSYGVLAQQVEKGYRRLSLEWGAT